MRCKATISTLSCRGTGSRYRSLSLHELRALRLRDFLEDMPQDCLVCGVRDIRVQRAEAVIAEAGRSPSPRPLIWIGTASV